MLVNEWRDSGGMLQQQGREAIKRAPRTLHTCQLAGKQAFQSAAPYCEDVFSH